MPSYFHVDRSKRLVAGQVVTLTRYDNIKPPEAQIHVDELFPSGVSAQGEQYFLQNGHDARQTSVYNELVFEYVRRALFPALPSRFTSFFGTESLDDACRFRAMYAKDASGNPSAAPIWEVECNQVPFRADMAVVTGAQSTILAISYVAHMYWRGESGPGPLWEVLLPLPVRVLRRIE